MEQLNKMFDKTMSSLQNFALRFLLSNLDDDVVDALNESASVQWSFEDWEKFIQSQIS